MPWRPSCATWATRPAEPVHVEPAFPPRFCRTLAKADSGTPGYRVPAGIDPPVHCCRLLSVFLARRPGTRRHPVRASPFSWTELHAGFPCAADRHGRRSGRLRAPSRRRHAARLHRRHLHAGHLERNRGAHRRHLSMGHAGQRFPLWRAVSAGFDAGVRGWIHRGLPVQSLLARAYATLVGHVADAHRRPALHVQPAETAARRGQAGKGGQPGQVELPRQHEP